jgi:hypothetical protein
MKQRTAWRILTVWCACLACLIAGAGVAQASERLTLDTHVGSSQAAGPVSTTAPLAAGAQYYAIVQGTMSIWPRSDWKASGPICGADEAAPLFPSPGVTNGAVGWDAETVFAVPPGVAFNGFACTATQIPFEAVAHSSGGFEISLGPGFAHMTPVGGARTTPRADHTYTYALTGQGMPASFEFIDQPIDDDYGVFKIQVLSAAECAAVNCVTAAATSSDQTVPADQDVTAGAVGGVSANNTLVVAPKNAARCSSRRDFVVHLRVPKGVKVRSFSEYLNGKVLRTVSGNHLKTTADLKKLPYGTFKLELRILSSREQVIRDIRVYHTCRTAAKSKKHKLSGKP